MTSKELIEKLPVIDEDIRNEAIRQPQLFVDAARYRVDKMRARSQAELELEGFMGSRGLQIRARGKTKAGEKITDSYVKAKIYINPEYKRLMQELNNAKAREEFAKYILEAYRQRNSALKILDNAQSYEAARGASAVERADVERKLSKVARRLHSRHQHVIGDDED